MTIEQAINKVRAGRPAIKAGHWRVTQVINERVYFRVYHYSTLMFEWTEFSGEIQVAYVDVGHGSVSDQQGMNRIFKHLDIRYYFSRKGGADIISR